MVTRWVRRCSFVFGAIVLAACGDTDSDSGTKATGGQAGVGAQAGDAATGDAAGSGGTSGFVGRKCGNGEPCAAGSTCRYSGIESGVNCTCDASGHFFCDAWASGGAPSFAECTEETAAVKAGACANDAATCEVTNGWCTRSCVCGGTCSQQCQGSGPASGPPVYSCDLAYCELDSLGYGSCKFEDGACTYEVVCTGESPTLTGSCP